MPLPPIPMKPYPWGVGLRQESFQKFSRWFQQAARDRQLLSCSLSQITRIVCMCCLAILKLFHPSVIGLSLKRSLDICRCFTKCNRELRPEQGEWAHRRNDKGQVVRSLKGSRGAPLWTLESRQAWGRGRCGGPDAPWTLASGLQLLSSALQASGILHAHLTLKITSVLALLPGRLDYRIKFSPPGWAMGKSSLLSLLGHKQSIIKIFSLSSPVFLWSCS